MYLFVNFILFYNNLIYATHIIIYYNITNLFLSILDIVIVITTTVI